MDAPAGPLPWGPWVVAPFVSEDPPPYSNPQGASMGNVTKGMQWTVDQVNAIVRGGLWSDVAVFITWDGWGGWYDHVEPPAAEAWNGDSHAGYTGSQVRFAPRGGCSVWGP